MSKSMNATPIDFGSTHTPSGVLPGTGRPLFGQASTSALSMKWSALHDAAAVAATLAGLTAESMTSEIRNFPSAMRDAGGWHRELAEQGIEDLNAIMEPGLSALLAVHARGVNPAAAAQALWQEFIAARDALMALTPPPLMTGPLGPMRKAL